MIRLLRLARIHAILIKQKSSFTGWNLGPVAPSHTRIMSSTCAGADVNSETKDGATALYEACRNNHSDITECLLSQCADANRPGKDGLLPLHLAAKHGNIRYNNTYKHKHIKCGVCLFYYTWNDQYLNQFELFQSLLILTPCCVTSV